MDDVVIKPSMGRTISVLLVCVAFTIGGVLLVLSGGWFDVALGIAAVATFGGGGGYYVWKALRSSTTFTLTPRGIDIGAGGFVPWSHVGRIGQTKVAGGVQALGVEVRNVAAYVGTLTAEQQRAALRTAKFGQRVGQSPPATDGDKSGDLDSIRKRDLAAALNWTAARSDGYHLTFPLLTLNKPADKLAEEVKAYRTKATGRGR